VSSFKVSEFQARADIAGIVRTHCRSYFEHDGTRRSSLWSIDTSMKIYMMMKMAMSVATLTPPLVADSMKTWSHI
jgi:hypothetical protein